MPFGLALAPGHFSRYASIRRCVELSLGQIGKDKDQEGDNHRAQNR